MGRVGPRGSCGKTVINRQIFIISCLQFVESDGEHLQAALAVARKVYRRVSLTCISTPLKTGSVESSGWSQAAVRDWYLNTAKEWFRGAIQKLTGGCP